MNAKLKVHCTSVSKPAGMVRISLIYSTIVTDGISKINAKIILATNTELKYSFALAVLPRFISIVMNRIAIELSATVMIFVYPIKLFANGTKPYASAPNVLSKYETHAKLHTKRNYIRDHVDR